MSYTSDAEPSFGFITPFVLPAFNPLLDLEIEKKYGQKWAGSVVVHNISTCTTVQWWPLHYTIVHSATEWSVALYNLVQCNAVHYRELLYYCSLSSVYSTMYAMYCCQVWSVADFQVQYSSVVCGVQYTIEQCQTLECNTLQYSVQCTFAQCQVCSAVLSTV